ncbi:hypothetical protein POX_e07212 [Penicillium oxalicum]|uniref:hypothetical protein n=1 Tax=Penicillium oxalicum TaxID=69781 RepID=UPI0020B731AC|nr:hypothetical protein POX_e07212 [Penicillium oxalicum]KAI2789183.1 hypothetical protein POX_e07212 [Penicillium oxalicum]
MALEQRQKPRQRGTTIWPEDRGGPTTQQAARAPKRKFSRASSLHRSARGLIGAAVNGLCSDRRRDGLSTGPRRWQDWQKGDNLHSTPASETEPKGNHAGQTWRGSRTSGQDQGASWLEEEQIGGDGCAWSRV